MVLFVVTGVVLGIFGLYQLVVGEEQSYRPLLGFECTGQGMEVDEAGCWYFREVLRQLGITAAITFGYIMALFLQD